MNWNKPRDGGPPPECSPDLEVNESEKFKDDGKWFENVGRYIVNQFYNPPIPNFNQGIDDPAYFGMTSVIDDVMDCYAHDFGLQYNKTFFDQTRTSGTKEVISKYLPSHKIYQLVNHIEGNGTKLIMPIRDSISARSLSRETLDAKKKEADRIRAAVRTKDELKTARYFGLEFEPTQKKYRNIEEAEVALKNYKDEYEIMAANIARGIFHNQHLSHQFLDDVRHTGIAGGVGTYIDEDGGKVIHKPIFIPNAIWDYRAIDDYQSNALLGGFIDFMTPAEIFARWGKWFNTEEKEYVTAAAKHGNEGATFRDYYNNHRRGLNHYNTTTNQVSVATVFFLARTDMRYRIKETKFGVRYPVKIDDNKMYDIEGVQGQVKGSAIPGDFKIWMVHKVRLVGNFKAIDYGYHNYQVKSIALKQMPQLPVKFFLHRFKLGHFRGIVSRLIAYSSLKELYKIKLQQKITKDKGRGKIWDAQQFGEGESILDKLDELEKLGHTMINRSKDGGINVGGRDIFTEADLSIAPEEINAYINLMALEDREMEQIANIPPAASGQMHNLNVGKGVQENVVAYSSLSQASFYEGLMEFWRMKMDYSVNLHKLWVLKSGAKEEVAMVSDGQIELMKFTKDYTSEDLMIFIALNDGIEGENKKILMQALQAYNQNPDIGFEALLNTLTIMKHNTFEESVQYLERYAERRKAEIEEARRRQEGEKQQFAQMQQAFAAQQKKMDAVLKMLSTVTNTNVAGAWAIAKEQGLTSVDPSVIIKDAADAAGGLLNQKV